METIIVIMTCLTSECSLVSVTRISKMIKLNLTSIFFEYYQESTVPTVIKYLACTKVLYNN